jgi:hypothetical protein
MCSGTLAKTPTAENMQAYMKEVTLMREEVLEETIRLEIEQQAERFGVNYHELSPNVQFWLRSLVIEQLYSKDTPQTVSPETAEEE